MVQCVGAAHLSTKSMMISEGVYSRSPPGLFQEGLIVDVIAPHTAAKPRIHETPSKQIKHRMHWLSAERWGESYYYNPGSGPLTTDGRPTAFWNLISGYRTVDNCSVVSRLMCLAASSLTTALKRAFSRNLHTQHTLHLHLAIDGMQLDLMHAHNIKAALAPSGEALHPIGHHAHYKVYT